MTSKTIRREVDVSTVVYIDVDLTAFTDDEIVAEYDDRGLKSDYTMLAAFDDYTVIQELHKRGYRVSSSEDDLVSLEAVRTVLSLVPEQRIGSAEYFAVENLKGVSYGG